MGISILAQWDELRCLKVGGGNLVLNGTWNELRLNSQQATAGSGVLTHNGRVIKIQNVSASNVNIGFTNSLIPPTIVRDLIPAGGFALYDITSNRSDAGGEFLIGESIYIWSQTYDGGIATGTGLFATIIYGRGE